MSVEAIISDWKKKVFKPVYWLEGEEPYFIDILSNYAEHQLLPASEASFNLTIFYGRDADWAAIINACRRYPMFAENQVVLIKEAQHLKDIDKLDAYIQNPLSSTILIICYKDKKVDGRSLLSKSLKKHAVQFTTKKLYESQLPEWTQNMIAKHQLSISPKALRLLLDHVGNDLSRIENEVQKLSLNIKNRNNITEDDIATYIGISKEFNTFELQDAISKKDFAKSINIIQYFKANPKAAPIQLILPALHNFFSKLYMLHALNTTDQQQIASSLAISPFFVKDYTLAAKNYPYPAVEKVLLLLHHYNLRSIGIGDTGTEDCELLKELLVKIMR